MAFNNALNAKSTGFQVLNSSGSVSGVSLAPTSNQTSITNTDGTGGNPVVSLTAPIYVSGISFNSGGNTLANYSTGTFSPTFTNGSTPPVVAYSVQLGRYTRIGNQIFTAINVTLSSYAAGTGGCQLDGLPFTTGATTACQWPLQIQNCTIVGQWVEGQIDASGTIVRFAAPQSASSAHAINNSFPTNTTQVTTTGVYSL